MLLLAGVPASILADGCVGVAMSPANAMNLRHGPFLRARRRVDLVCVTVAVPALLSVLAHVALHRACQLLLLRTHQVLLHDLPLHVLGGLVGRG